LRFLAQPRAQAARGGIRAPGRGRFDHGDDRIRPLRERRLERPLGLEIGQILVQQTGVARVEAQRARDVHDEKRGHNPSDRDHEARVARCGLNEPRFDHARDDLQIDFDVVDEARAADARGGNDHERALVVSRRLQV